VTEPAPDHTVESRLLAARTRLILERPFLGALVLRLPLQPADGSWCPTTRTDARTLFYNPAHVASLTLDQVQFTLCAQALHCALLHFTRRGHREQARWERACSLVVDSMLVEEGLVPAPGVAIDHRFAGMTAEEVYPLLAETPPPPRARKPQGGALAPPPSDPAERRYLEQQWKRRLAGVAQQALQAGRLSEGMRRMLESVLQPTLPWRAVLARHMNGIARDDFSYSRPSSRRGGPAIFPSLRSAELDVVVAVDVSGSIGAREFDEFMAEVDALKAQVRARMTLLTCDARITGDAPWFFEPWERFELPAKLTGSGATDFRPVFDWVASRERRPDLLIYFTDAAGRFPEVEPVHPVIWLVKGDRTVPWGERIQLN
jgi:predicted metal-dependent peptidase